MVFALAQASVNYLWGRTSISARGTSGVVQTGIGPWGRRQTFLFPAINGVRLTLSTEDGAQGKDGARHVVRMEGVGFYVDFGEEFTEKQRMFMALTVLKWIVATRQNA